MYNDSLLVGTLGGVAFAYRFNGENWVEEHTFDECCNPNFGYTVSIHGGKALIGELGIGDFPAPRAFPYRRDCDGWTADGDYLFVPHQCCSGTNQFDAIVESGLMMISRPNGLPVGLVTIRCTDDWPNDPGVFWDGHVAGSGSYDGVFNDPLNWSPDVLPDLYRAATFDVGQAYDVTFNADIEICDLRYIAGDVLFESNAAPRVLTTGPTNVARGSLRLQNVTVDADRFTMQPAFGETATLTVDGPAAGLDVQIEAALGRLGVGTLHYANGGSGDHNAALLIGRASEELAGTDDETGVLLIDSGSHVLCGGPVELSHVTEVDAAHGRISVGGPGFSSFSHTDAGNPLLVGLDNGGSPVGGTVEVFTQGTFEAGRTFLEGNGLIHVDGGTFRSLGDMTASAGLLELLAGTLKIDAGAELLVTGSGLVQILGGAMIADGDVTVSGGLLEFDGGVIDFPLGGELTIAGTGVVQFHQGGLLQNGTYRISGGEAELLTSGQLTFGSGATLILQNGALLDATSIDLEDIGTLDLVGGTITATQLLRAPSYLVINGTQPGNRSTIEIRDGALGEVDYAWRIAEGPGTVGTTIVDGFGQFAPSTIRNAIGGTAGDLLVGGDGDGELLLTNGGRAEFDDDLVVGEGPSGTGDVDVIGVGNGFRSTIEMGPGVDATATFGRQGTAVVDVMQGGLVAIGGDVILAEQPGSATIVTVGGSEDGYDATLAVGRDLAIGGSTAAAGGVATLTVTADGVVSVPGDITMWPDSQLEVTGTLAASGDFEMFGGEATFTPDFTLTAGTTFSATAGSLSVDDDQVITGSTLEILGSSTATAHAVTLAAGGTLRVGSLFATDILTAQDATIALADPDAILAATGSQSIHTSCVITGEGTLDVPGPLTAGTIIPEGSPIGQIFINSDVMLDSESKVVVDLNAAGSDELNVEGSIFLDGTLTVELDDEAPMGTQYAVIIADAVEGEFDQVNLPDAAFTISYMPDHVLIELCNDCNNNGLCDDVVQVPGDYEFIQDAIDASCDQVVVAPGTYHETLNFHDRAIIVRSSSGPEVTIIDGTGAGPEGTDALHVVEFVSGEGASSVLRGFTITGGTAVGATPDSDGGGIHINNNSSPTIIDCIVTGNSAENRGGGVSIDSFSFPDLINCVVHENVALYGGGVYVDGESAPDLVNCTVSGNTATNTQGAGLYAFTGEPDLTNCIVWGNVPDGIWSFTATPTVTYSNVQGAGVYPGTGNISADPHFADVAQDDYRLGRYSPCVDAGDNDAVVEIGSDLDGNPRVAPDDGVPDTGNPPAQGEYVDMGAFERQNESEPVVVSPGASIQEAITEAFAVDQIEVNAGTYVETIDFQGKAVHLRAVGGPAVTVIDGNGAFHVVTCSTGEGPGTILEGFTVTGGSASDFVLPNSRGAGMYNFGASPTVLNCVFAGNFAQSGGAGMYNSSGSSPAVINCVFTGNTAGRGAGMHNLGSTPTLTNCTFSGNVATQAEAGAIYNLSNSDIVVRNSILWNDTQPEIVNADSSSSNVTYSNVQGGYAGIGNLNANPLLVDADGPDDVPGTIDDNLRLSRFSPSTDVGSNNAVPALADPDPDGLPRFDDDAGVPPNGAPAVVDMGAYERHTDSTPGLLNVPGDASTIQSAIDLAFDGDEIIVGPGTYVEAIDFGGRQIEVRSTDGPEMTIIDGNGADHVVTCMNGEGPAAVLDGFTITGGVADGSVVDDNGAGMLVGNHSSPTVLNCIFENNVANNHGGALSYGADGTATISDCIFRDNSAGGRGGGLWYSGVSGTVTRCIFENNSSGDDGGAVKASTAVGHILTLRDCTMVGNDAADDGGAVFNQGHASTLINCVLRGNAGLGEGGAISSSGPDVTLVNCTVTGNFAGVDGGGLFGAFSDATVTNCIFWNNGASEIVNGSNGTATVTYSLVQGGHPGTGNIDVDPSFIASDNLRLAGCSSAVDAGDNDAVPAGVQLDLDGNDRFTDDAVMPDSGNGAGDLVDMGAYERQTDSVPLATVPTDYGTLQAAIDVVCPQNGIVEVEPGTYVEAIDLSGKAITLRSTGGAAVTTIDGGGAFHVVQCVSGEGSDTVLDGFTITGGMATGVGGDADGAGMLNDGTSPTVQNCIFRDNWADDQGGGMYNTGGASPTLMNNVYRDNTAANGGGMYNNAGAVVIINCSFNGNLAFGQFGGGAMYNSGPSATTVVNSILWGDLPNENAGLGSPDFAYCNIEGGNGSGTNLNVDPLFLPDLQLSPCSPSIDAGSSTALPDSITEDLAGDPRHVDDAGVADSGAGSPPIDMGAYERQTDSLIGGVASVPGQFATIQEAVDSACTIDEIVVAPGTYVGTIDFKGRSITIRSLAGPEATILDGGGAPHVVQCISGELTDSVLEGFTITGGDASGQEADEQRGAGLQCLASSPTIRDCIFTGNAATGPGGAVHVDGGAPEFHGCLFLDNSAGQGGAIYTVAASALVYSCSFVGNVGIADAGAIYNDGSDPIVANCEFIGNSTLNAGTVGGAMVNLAASPAIVNCTFHANSAVAQGGAMISLAGSSPTVTGCIFWNDSPDEVSEGGSATTMTYSLIPGGFTGVGNVDADPLFVDAAGEDSTPGTSDDDLRLDPCSPAIDAADNGALPVAIDTDLSGEPRILDDDGMPDAGNGTGPIVDMGAYERQSDSLSGTGTVPIDFPTIQAAIDAACDAAEIIVAPGTYLEAIDFKGKALTLRSSGGPEVTTIDGGGAVYHVVRLTGGEGPGTVLDGFTITGGVADGAGGDARGGGIYINDGSPTVRNCIIRDNEANRGGGMFVLGSSLIVNCIFAGNSAGFQGGGAWAAADPTFVNGTFHANMSANGGGLLAQLGSTVTVVNSLFWDNTVNTIEDLSAGGLTVTYSDVEGGWPGAGNIDADPMFVGAPENLRLLPLSPCFDVGDNASVPAAITTDLVGEVRIYDADGDLDPVVDLGAFESPVTDCNGNGADDLEDIFLGLSLDANSNFIPDECETPPCPWDCGTVDGFVDTADFLTLLSQWGQVGSSCDFDGSGVNVTAFLALLSHWGPCP